MKKSLLFISLTLLISCATTSKTPTPVRQTIDNIQLNQVKKTEIGEKLIEKGEVLINKAVKIESIPNTNAYKNTKIRKGEILPIQYIYAGYSYYHNEQDYGVSISIKSKKAYEFGSSVTTGLRKTITKETIGYSETTTMVKCNDCFKQEIIFNGKVNNSLKFIYREYVNDMARPAFTQDMQYDLAESNIIGFKGLRIEVIKATNTNIEYKVLSSFN